MKKFILLFNLFLFAGILHAQVLPTLGSAGSFGVLSGDTINSTDTVRITGNAGATGTIDSKIIATTIYQGGGLVVTNALADLNTAKLFLTSQGGTNISGTLSGQSLNPGVYSISGNAFLNDTIILNGDTNAIFIFNISGNLTINANSMVKTGIFNSVNPKNIFWNVGGVTTINSNSTFGGVVLAANAITINARFSGSVCLLSQEGISFTEEQVINYPGLRLGYAVYSHDKFPAPAGLACTGPGIFNCGETIDNGSFEYYDPTYGCPVDVTMPGDPYIGCPWDEMPGPGFSNTTPDLFNTCATGTNVWVPLNGFGTQAPNTGSGYAGLYSGDTGPNA